jgi:hypothetical protein
MCVLVVTLFNSSQRFRVHLLIVFVRLAAEDRKKKETGQTQAVGNSQPSKIQGEGEVKVEVEAEGGGGLTEDQLQQHEAGGNLRRPVFILPPIGPTPTDISLSREQTQASMGTTGDGEEELEWYQQQLYNILGPQARDFLHPKMAAKPVQPRVTSRKSKMRRLGGE